MLKIIMCIILICGKFNLEKNYMLRVGSHLKVQQEKKGSIKGEKRLIFTIESIYLKNVYATKVPKNIMLI